jgi:hypothetical protein
MREFPSSVRLIPLLAALACLAGCGSMTSAPVLDESGARVATNGAGTQQSFTMPIDEPQLPDGGAPVLEPAPEEELPLGGGGSTQDVGTMLNGDAGGTVRSGRWRVDVPPGAVSGSARISVTPSSKRGGIVNLGIFPSEKNHFDRPVRLVADCHGIPPHQLATWCVSWYNPSSRSWELVPGATVDTRRKTISVSLSHFSTYMVGPEVGRAGW